MMIKNKYYIWYTNIIDASILQKRAKGDGTYYERHHIIPKSLGGGNNKSNLVLLTAKEHVICHHLLTKFTEGEDRSKMFYAFWSLINGWGKHRVSHRITARQYAILKEQIATQISEQKTGRPGKPCTPENRESARKRMLGPDNHFRGKPPHNKGKKRPGVGGRKKGTKWSEEERRYQMNVRSAPDYYAYFKCPERCKKISKSQKGREGTSTGTTWCNDGIKEYQVKIIPPGFNKGRLINNASKIGLRWFNNGIENRQFREGSEPKGFVHGRLSKK